MLHLAYAPKEKFLVRLDQQSSLEDRQFAVTLPRMGFEISGIEYDGSRKLTKVQKFKSTKTNSNNVMNFNYMLCLITSLIIYIVSRQL